MLLSFCKSHECVCLPDAYESDALVRCCVFFNRLEVYACVRFEPLGQVDAQLSIMSLSMVLNEAEWYFPYF